MKIQSKIAAWNREFEEFMILKNLSPRTIKTYCQILRYFLNDYEQHYAPKPLNDDVARAECTKDSQAEKDQKTPLYSISTRCDKDNRTRCQYQAAGFVAHDLCHRYAVE
jgi:hypothetical protein